MGKGRIMDEREEILSVLEEHDSGEIPFGLITRIMSIMLLVLSCFIPKIYISANIYYKSLEIAKLRGIHQSLSEEKIQLEQKLEVMTFKNKVLDKL